MSNRKISRTLAKSLLNKLGHEGINCIQQTGELPAVKLTASEMECLRGVI